MFRSIAVVCAIALAPHFAGAEDFLGKTSFEWLQTLESKKWQDRRDAAFALGKLHSTAAIEKLVDTVRRDSSGQVREAAAFALGEISHNSGSGRADLSKALIAALSDANPQVRRSAAVALGYIGDPSAIQPLSRSFSDGRNRDQPTVRRSIAWSLAHLGPDAIPTLRQALRDRSPLVQRDAAALKEAIDNGILTPADVRPLRSELLKCCRTENREVRKKALQVLARILDEQDKDAIPTLRRVIQEKGAYNDREVKLNAAFALANMGQAAGDAVPVLRSALARGQIQERRQAAAALGNFGEEAASAVGDLITALNVVDDKVRENAAIALGGIGEKAASAVPKLVKMVARNTETETARAAAADALSEIGLVKAAIDGVPTLTRVLADPESPPAVRERIMWALRVHKRALAKMPIVLDTFRKVLTEKPSIKLWDKNRDFTLDAGERSRANEDVKMVRYDCAYMLAMLKEAETSKLAMDVLLEWLRDEGTEIFTGTDVKTGGSSVESGSGKTTVEQMGKGDARVMVAQALRVIGPKRIKARRDIVDQLRRLAANRQIDSELRVQAKRLLDSL